MSFKKTVFAVAAAMLTATTAQAAYIKNHDFSSIPKNQQLSFSNEDPTVFITESDMYMPKDEALQNESRWVKLTQKQIDALDKGIVSCQPCDAGAYTVEAGKPACVTAFAFESEGEKFLHEYQEPIIGAQYDEAHVVCFCPCEDSQSSYLDAKNEVCSMEPYYFWEDQADTAVCFGRLEENVGAGGYGHCEDNCTNFASLLNYLGDRFCGFGFSSGHYGHSRLGGRGSSFDPSIAGAQKLNFVNTNVPVMTDRSLPNGGGNPWIDGSVPRDNSPFIPSGGKVPWTPTGGDTPWTPSGDPQNDAERFPTPEPETLVLFGMGLAALAARGRARKVHTLEA